MDVCPALPSNGTCTLVQEVGQEAAHDSLVGDDEDIALTLQLHDDRLQPLHQVLVRLWGKWGGLGGGTSWQPSQWLCLELRGRFSFLPSWLSSWRFGAFVSPANHPQPWYLLRILRLFKSNVQTEKIAGQEEKI